MNYMFDIILVDDTIFLAIFFVSFGFGCELCGEFFITFFLGMIYLAYKSFLVSRCWILFMVDGFC